ncbi:hypothetical protein OHA25_43655 [Nonomuraea sp. NBC_00507]|uniref:hypothetical protein n=1 Tax=Nonomuraea sp. NBC_00507 TaxID=2976002 RepID=UPI002E1901CD
MSTSAKTAAVVVTALTALTVLSLPPTASAQAAVGAFAGPASGSVSVTIAEKSAAGTAPACIHRNNMPLLKSVLVSNWCNKAMRVKVIVRVGPDSGCWRMHSGNVRYHDYHVGYYQKVVTC